ncbi:MAG TPA: hypothetical protein VGF97_12935 [Rhizomicrobium sp.]|jgi:hypothetical protein
MKALHNVRWRLARPWINDLAAAAATTLVVASILGLAAVAS